VQRAEAAIEHGTAKGLMEQLSMLDTHAASEPDAKISANPCPSRRRSRPSRQAALEALAKDLRGYIDEQRAISARTRQSVEEEVTKAATAPTDVEPAANLLDTATAQAAEV
jgi:hypothetical protein